MVVPVKQGQSRWVASLKALIGKGGPPRREARTRDATRVLMVVESELLVAS